MTQEKRLNRSRDALLGGVCAGVAEYFDVDPVVVRILVVVLTVASAGLFRRGVRGDVGGAAESARGGRSG